VRIEGRIRLGYFPLPLPEAERIRQHLQLTPRFVALDPCIGEGHALGAITAGVKGHCCGIELDAFRAEQASRRADQVVHASAFDVHCPAESISLLYCNPPYDFEISEGKNERMERVFLQSTYRWLKPGGVLVLVLPCRRLADCSEILAWNFKDVSVYALTEPECVKYNQTVLLGIRRTRSERERVRDDDVSRQRTEYYRTSRTLDELRQLHPLTDRAARIYAVPAAEPVTLLNRGLPLDEIEDLLAKSPAYRQASRLLIGKEDRVAGRPLTPLHGGHVGLLAVSGLLNGIFGEGPALHIARWQSVKVTDTIEETDDAGITTIREKERFSHELRVVFRDGRVVVLK
jgi:SAM-dependent methyltransferase